jgi:hypothetical protein
VIIIMLTTNRESVSLLIDGFLTIPVALYGFFLFPDTPHTTTAFYLSTEERELAISQGFSAATKKEDPSVESQLRHQGAYFIAAVGLCRALGLRWQHQIFQ